MSAAVAALLLVALVPGKPFAPVEVRNAVIESDRWVMPYVSTDPQGGILVTPERLTKADRREYEAGVLIRIAMRSLHSGYGDVSRDLAERVLAEYDDTMFEFDAREILSRLGPARTPADSISVRIFDRAVSADSESYSMIVPRKPGPPITRGG